MDISELEKGLAALPAGEQLGMAGLNAAYAIGGVVIGVLIGHDLTTADEIADVLEKRSDIPGMVNFARCCRMYMPGGSGLEVIEGGKS
jgi:hypothetical protein